MIYPGVGFICFSNNCLNYQCRNREVRHQPKGTTTSPVKQKSTLLTRHRQFALQKITRWLPKKSLSSTILTRPALCKVLSMPATVSIPTWRICTPSSQTSQDSWHKTTLPNTVIQGTPPRWKLDTRQKGEESKQQSAKMSQEAFVTK